MSAATSSSLASIWEEVCLHNHPNSESSDMLACRTMLSKVKKALALFSTAPLASEADLTLMLNLFEIVLKGQFCQSAHSALGNRDSTFKNLTMFISYLCNENNICSAHQAMLMRNIALLASIEVEDGDENGDFREICKDLAILFQQAANGRGQEIQAFSNATRISLKRFEISSPAARNALLCGSAMSLEALCNAPLVLLGNIPSFIQAFESICNEISSTKQYSSKVLHTLCHTANTLALNLPNSQYRFMECLLDLLNDIVDEQNEWTLKQVTDLCDFVLALFQGDRANKELLALHAATPMLDLVRKLTRKTPSALLEPLLKLALDLTRKVITIQPQATALALLDIPMFSETSVFIQACSSSMHERLAGVLKSLFQVYPAHFDLAHALFRKEHMGDKQPDAKKQVLYSSHVVNKDDTNYLHFLAKSGTFCSTLLRIHMFSELEPEWALETCLQELRSHHQDDYVVCLLTCASQYFPGNASIWDLASSKLQLSISSFSNAPAITNLLGLLVRMRPSIDSAFPLPSNIPYQSFSHVDMNATNECLKTLTCLIMSNPSVDCATHLKRIVDQVPETSELAHIHLANWEAIVFSPQIDLAVRLLVVDSMFTVLTKATCAAPSAQARQTMETFLKRAILCDELHIRVPVARQFGCLVKFGVGTRALQSTDVSALITALNSNLEDACLKAKRRHMLIAIGSIGCAINLADSVSMTVLSWVLTKLSSQWMEASTSSIVEKTTAREEFRRIANAHGCTVVELFDLVSKQIYPVLVAHLLRGEQPKTTLDRFVSEVFGDTSTHRAINTLGRLLPVILPYYMVKQKEDYLPTLQRIACLMEEETEFTPNLLANLLFCEVKLWIIDFVEAHVANRANERVFAMCPSITFPQYLSAAKRKILETYVLKLAVEKELNPRAMQVLELMATEGHLPEDCEECKKHAIVSSSSTSSAVVDCRSVEYLVRNEFMFMMYSLSQAIQDKSSAIHLSSKKQALRCTSRLLQLLGASCHADDFIPRVLPTLADALQDVELQTEACDTIKILATKLSEEALEKNMLGFIVALLPCFHHITFANVATEVVAWLLVAHKLPDSTICSAYDLLPTNDPALKAAVVAMEPFAMKRTLAMRINQLSTLIDNNSDEISLLALTELEQLLSEPGTNVTALLNGKSSGNTVISTLFQRLLKVARSVGSRIRNSKQQQQHRKQLVDQFADAAANKTRNICLKCCNCIGLLGAVDPARLRFESEANDTEDGKLDLGNSKLAITLLRDFLIDALNAAPDSDTHMKVGLVIQEMVRFLGAENIPAEFTSTVRLFLRTNYEISDSCPAASQFEESFFHQSPSFASSIGKWVTHLCSKSQREQFKVFSPLWVLRDSNCATRMMLFVLPYAVQNVLCTCDDDDANSILNEVQGILYRGSCSDVDDGRDQLSVQAVFLLLDTLERWTTASALEMSMYQGEFADKSKVVDFLQSIHKVDLAEAAFRIGSFSRALFYLEAHIRATHGANRSGGGVSGPGSWRQDEPTALLAKEMELLHKIYAASNDQDPDGLKGVVALRIRQGGEPSLMEQIHELENDAKWNDALKCYEEAIEIATTAATGNEDGKIAPMLHEGQLRCLWRAGNLDLVVNAAEGKAAQNPKLRSLVLPYSLDALWRLGKWTQLKSALHCDDNAVTSNRDPFARRGAPGGVSGTYTESLSRALLCAVEKSDFTVQVENAQLELLGLLSAASMESYERSYPLIVRLHGLVELKCGLLHSSSSNEEEWLKARLNLTSPDSSLRSELLALRRSVHRIATAANPRCSSIDKFETDNWLSLAKTARKFGDITVCESALSVVRRTLQLDVDHNSLKQTCLLQVKIQRAKLFKEREDLHSALQTLEPCGELLTFTPICDPTLAKFRAKALLLHTKLVLENGSLHGQAILDRFRAVLQWDPTSQKAKLHMAKYQDYLLDKMQQQAESGSKSSELLIVVLGAYGDCLMSGNKSYFEVLPRILTLWYTHAERELAAAAAGETAKKAKQPAIPAGSKVDEVISTLAKTLPVSIWYTALAQLVSHICNPHEGVWKITKQILINILSHYPAKALWSVMGVYLSKMDARKSRASELLRSFNEHGAYRKNTSTSSHSSSSDGTRLSKTTASQYVNVSVRVFEAFIKLANDRSESKVKPSTIFADVQHLISHASSSSSISSATESGGSHYGLVLPILSCLREDETRPVLFQSVGEKVDVMRSKEKPKKIRLIGTNGVTYNFLCKREERGDLRKDARLMEFNAVVNALFMRDVQAQRRGLKVRTYNVVCLNESCGLLEWVENTMGFKSQLIDLYSGDLVFQARAQVERIQQECPLNVAGNRKRMRNRYVDEVLSTLPPRFHKWFLNNFSDPAIWLSARTAFTRSSAVWSMMGYVLGLGDRHAENLLLDVKTGEAVHVDFDCLFDKGLTLKKPEIVPFRLTRNMVDGMGVCGIEGMFRGTCEITLRVLRTNKDMLLSVLESFVVDPLVEWTKRGVPSGNNNDNAGSKHEAKETLRIVTERLAGVVRDRETMTRNVQKANRVCKSLSINSDSGRTGFASVSFEAIPLSYAGQVDRLIAEAIDEEKLCQMFCGWCSFL